jgi:hypothetical protein
LKILQLNCHSGRIGETCPCHYWFGICDFEGSLFLFSRSYNFHFFLFKFYNFPQTHMYINSYIQWQSTSCFYQQHYIHTLYEDIEPYTLARIRTQDLLFGRRTKWPLWKVMRQNGHWSCSRNRRSGYRIPSGFIVTFKM